MFVPTRHLTHIPSRVIGISIFHTCKVYHHYALGLPTQVTSEGKFEVSNKKQKDIQTLTDLS